MIIDNIKQLATENGYELTEYAEKIAKAKERFFGEEEWQRCCCVRDDKHFCISPSCLEDINNKGICDCRLYKKKEQ